MTLIMTLIVADDAKRRRFSLAVLLLLLLLNGCKINKFSEWVVQPENCIEFDVSRVLVRGM